MISEKAVEAAARARMASLPPFRSFGQEWLLLDLHLESTL